MSSPFHLYTHMDSSTTLASTFSAFTEDTSPPPDMDQTSDDLSIRSMNLKVLYSFDEGNKTNCLARWPHALNIRVAALDDSAEIGVIELKTCIQAIVNASPELLTKLGHDYTIYAYDYSEYETPLVGQGMLSWALASASTTPDAPAHQSNTIVTGRVCKNIMGIFTKGARETLEVKLRLVPVPTALQGEYLASMQKYRETANPGPQDADGQALTSFVQGNPGFFAGANPTRPSLQRSSSTPVGTAGIGAVHQLLRESASPRDTTGTQTISQNQQMQSGNSRPPTPAMYQAPGQPSQPHRAAEPQGSRPSSRASTRGPTKRQAQAAKKRVESMSGEYASNDDVVEEGPAKKRARVIPAEYPVMSSIEKQPDSLRVAAGMASSVRNLFVPIAIKPASLLAAGTNEEPVRPPTPIPKPPPQKKGRKSRAASSNLRRESITQDAAAYVSPYITASVEQPALDSGFAGSPEQTIHVASFSNTPANIPSSPPVYEDMTSAPGTPRLPRNSVRRQQIDDSGFLSAETDHILEDDHDFPLLTGDDWNLEPLPDAMPDIMANNSLMSEIQFQDEMPGPPQYLPQRVPPRTFDHKSRRALITPDAAAFLPSDIFSEQPLVDALPAPLPRRKTRPLDVLAEQTQSETGPSLPQEQPFLDEPTLLPPKDFSSSAQQIPLPESQAAPSALQTNPQPQQVAEALSQDNMQILAQPEIAITAPSRPSSRPSSRAGRKPKAAPPVPAVPNVPNPAVSRPLARTQSVGSIQVPVIPASDPVQAQPARLQRSQTWADHSQHPASDAPMSSMDSRPKGRAGSGAKRSAQIQARLQASVESGEMPPYCENCGAIETPTWRKAYGRVFTEGFENLRASDEDGGVILWDNVKTDDQGTVISFRVIKKTLLKSEMEEWPILLLCNPCGLYLFKWKAMRPEDRWVKKPKEPKEKRKRPPRRRSRKTQSTDQAGSDGQARQDSTAGTDVSSPADGGVEPDEEFEDESEMPPAQRPRAQSAEPSKSPAKSNERWEDPDTAAAALQRAIQASPAGRRGSQRAPIVLEESPSTRRILFPSPRKKGEMKTLDSASLPTTSPRGFDGTSPIEASLQPLTNGTPTALQRSPRPDDTLHTTTSRSPTTLRRSPRINKQIMMQGLDLVGKENFPPALVVEDDGLGDLFDDEGLPEIPTTPTPSSRSSRSVRYRTPSPASKAAQFIITPGQKSAHVKQVMKLMSDPTSASPLECRNLSDLVESKKHQLSPNSAAFAEMLQSGFRTNESFNTHTPSKPPSNSSSSNQSPDSNPADPSTYDISQLEDLGPDFFANDTDPFQDDPFGSEPRPFIGGKGMTKEEERRFVVDNLLNCH